MTPGMSCPCAIRPQPIWPIRIRRLAPQTREGMKRGAALAAAAPRVDFSNPRREIEFMERDPRDGRSGEYMPCHTRPARDARSRSTRHARMLFVPERIDGIELRSLS